MVIGRQACRLLLEHTSATAAKLFVEGKGRDGTKRSPDLDELISLAEQNGVAVSYSKSDELDQFAGHSTHQGVAIELRERKFSTVSDLIEQTQHKERALFVALDELFDPQNVGSILRAAECFGVDGVIWSKNRGVGITPTVTKVSAGASELVPLAPVSNLRTELGKLQKNGFYVLVADGGEDSQSAGGYEFPDRAVLVLGSEGKGIQPLIRKEADGIIGIPMSGLIDSLNVSQAAAVLLAFWSDAGQNQDL